MNIVVYCSSIGNLPPCYVEAAQTTGGFIAQNHCSLLYGGVNAGLMHTTALEASRGAEHIIGVVPECFRHRADALVTELVLCSDLNHRKGIMIERGDLFVALPGGIGTIDEIISTLSVMKVQGDQLRKLIVVNIGGVFDALLKQLYDTVSSPFTTGDGYMHNIVVVDSVSQLNEKLTEILEDYDKK